MRDVSDEMPGINHWIQSGAGKYYTEPGMEEVLQEFYGMAVAMTAKVAFEQGTYDFDKKQNRFVMFMNGTATQTVLHETAGLGLLEVMAGNARVNEMLSENASNGNVSRQELLKAGYPVEDVKHMTAFSVQMNQYDNSVKRNQTALDKEKKEYPDPDENRKKDWDARQKKIDDMKEVAERMRQIWNEVTNPASGPLTQEKRLENLRRLKTGAGLATEKGLVHYCLEQFPERMDRRIGATLTTGDKAMLAGDYTSTYNALQEADPRTLFTGSRQFKELKKSVKELAEMEQSLSPEARKNSRQFWEKKREVLEKSQTYLLREKKSVTDISHPGYIEMEEYDRGGVYGLSKTTDKLKLSKDYQKEVLGELGMNKREELTYLKTQSQKEARLKEAPVGRKKPEEVLDTKKRSKEVGDVPVKNTLKEKKVDKGVYL